MAVTRRASQVLAYVVAGVAAVAVVVVILLPSHHAASLDDRTHAVAAELRCPTCAGESAADSTSPMAESMRAEVRRQLATGRSESQVVSWFRDRYGDGIVLAPPRRGIGWVFRAAPPAAALAVLAGALIVRRRRTSRPPDDEPAASVPLPARRLPAVLAVAVVAAVAVPLVLHHGPGDESSAAAPTSAGSSPATSAEDADPVSTAFALLRAGHPVEAASIVRRPAHEPGRDRALALLVLGLAERADGQGSAQATLRVFVRRYPHHPAAAQVRRLLMTPVAKH